MWTGGPGSGVGWDDFAQGSRPDRAYPLESPEPGDLILVRFGGRQGRGIGVVHRNGYRENLSEAACLDVIWVNRTVAKLGNFVYQQGFSRARRIADVFFACDAYAPTFRRLAALGYTGEPTTGEATGDDGAGGLSREAVLRAIGEFEELGREGFLQRYGYNRSRHLWIVHEERRYDMKAVWGGRAR